MKTLVIPINWVCTSKCLFCQYNRFDGKNMILLNELEAYKKLYNEWKFWNVMITDWETLNHNNIFSIIDFIFSFTESLVIDTNWEKFWERDFFNEFIKKYKDKNIIIKIPVYWSNAEIHNFITKWNFDNVIKWVVYLKKYSNFKVLLHCLILKQNYKYLENIKKIVLNLWYNINFIYTIPDWYINSEKLLISFSEILKYNKNISIDNVPKCINYINLNKNIDLKTTIIHNKIVDFKNDFLSNRLKKNYLNKCLHCEFIKECDWVYEKYIDIFWENEFL